MGHKVFAIIITLYIYVLKYVFLKQLVYYLKLHITM